MAEKRPVQKDCLRRLCEILGIDFDRRPVTRLFVDVVEGQEPIVEVLLAPTMEELETLGKQIKGSQPDIRLQEPEAFRG